MAAFQRSKHPDRLKPLYQPSTTSLQKLHHNLYLHQSHPSSAAIPLFSKRKLAFIRPVLQKTLVKWMLPRWKWSKKRCSSDTEKCRVNRRSFIQMPSVSGVQLRSESNERLCQKMVKNRNNAIGCNPNRKMAVSQADFVKADEKFCGKDVTTCGASCSAISARHLTVGSASCSAPLFMLPVSEVTETGNCLNIGNSSVSDCDEVGMTCALKICNHKVGEKMLCADGSDISESRNFPNCVDLCSSACEDGHLSRHTVVLNNQPRQALKVTSFQTEGKKTASHPQTFCDAFSQFLMCSNRTMDPVKRKIEKFHDQKSKCMANLPQDCINDKFCDVRTNISARVQPDYKVEVLPRLMTKVSMTAPPEFNDEALPVYEAQISTKEQLDSSDKTFPDLMAQPFSKVPQLYDDGKLSGVGLESPCKIQTDRNNRKRTFKRDLELSKTPEMNSRSENDSEAITSISCVDNSIPDVSDVVTGDLNSTVQIGSSCMANKSPNISLHPSFAENLALDVTTHILTKDCQIDKNGRAAPNGMKDKSAEEAIPSFAVKHPTMVSCFSEYSLNAEFKQQHINGSKVNVAENLDSGISDSEQASSRHTIDSSQGSLGVTDVDDIAMETTEDVATETATDVSTETSNRHQPGSCGTSPVCSGLFHHNHSSVKRPDATAKELIEELAVDESSDSDSSHRIRVLESHCRPVRVLLRRLTSEAIDALCNNLQVDSVKPCHPEWSPQAKPSKKRDPPLSAKPRQQRSSKTEAKKRKPKPPSWSKDDLAQSITLDLLNWLPDLVDGGSNIRRSSNAMKRKFDGSVSDESLDDSMPYVPNFMTHSNFDSPECSLLEKWQKVCELEREWLEDTGINSALFSYQPNTSCTTGDRSTSLNCPGSFSSGVPQSCLLDKSQRGASTEPAKRKTRPKKKEPTGATLDKGQSRTPTKTKARKQSKKTEVNIIDEASSDISSLTSCHNSTKLMQQETVVGGNFHEENTPSVSTLNNDANNQENLTGNTEAASSVTRNLHLTNPLHGNSPTANSVTEEPISKNSLNGNFPNGNSTSGNILTRNTPTGNVSIVNACSGNAPIANTLSRNNPSRNACSRNSTTVNAVNMRTPTRSAPAGSNPTENTSAGSSVARNIMSDNTSTKNFQKGNLIIIDPLARKPQPGNTLAKKPITRNFQIVNIHTRSSTTGNSLARGSSTEILQTVTNSAGNALSVKTQPEIAQITNTTVKCELISKSSTDRVEFGQQKSQVKFSVLPQLKSPVTVSLETKSITSVSDSNSPPTKCSKDSNISSENEKLQLSSTGFLSVITSSTCSSPSHVPGLTSTIASIKPVAASNSCHSCRDTNIPANITSIMPMVTNTSNSPTLVTSIASSASAVLSPGTTAPPSTVHVAHAGSRSTLNCSVVSSVAIRPVASTCSSVSSSQTLSTELAGESGQSKEVIVEATFNSLSDDLKSSSAERTKSRRGSAKTKPPKTKQMAKPRAKPTSDTRIPPPNCNPDGTTSGLPTLNQTSVSSEFHERASAGAPAQVGGELSEPRCNKEMSSWLAASMGLYTCLCGAAFSDSWACHQHQSNCLSGLPE